jgi:PadR family transcriptional regulator, regulatory protein PadR
MNNATPPHQPAPNELFDALRLELRRGCLVVAVLAQLKSEQYGYTLRKSLSDDGLAIDESTLYPLLRRLESQGLLLSEWREENKRNKRFYRLSPSGAQVLGQLLDEWRRINTSLDRMVDQRSATGSNAVSGQDASLSPSDQILKES